MEADRDEDQRDPYQAGFAVPESNDVGSPAPASWWFPIVVELLLSVANSRDSALASAFTLKLQHRGETHEAAANAECFVCSRISAKVLSHRITSQQVTPRMCSMNELNVPRNHRYQQIEHPKATRKVSGVRQSSSVSRRLTSN